MSKVSTKENLEATRRADERRQKARCVRITNLNLNETIVVTKPTSDEEIKLFKAIVRHVTKHEAEQEKAKWFRADTRASLRRLSDLGVSGHQPSIMAYCQMTKNEKGHVVETILKQKVANNKKAEATYVERRERQKKADESEEAAQAFAFQGNKILLRIARVATGASVKWKRSVRTNVGSENETGNVEERKQDEVKYQNRLLACTRCGSKQETKEKQLKVNVGFRAIHCKIRKKRKGA